jgi:DNA-binding LacI/PurR family transcriptional regulator
VEEATMNKTEALYQSLKASVIGQEPQSRFPSTRELMKRYRVSQVTVIQAAERLVQDGLISKSQGKSTLVTELVRSYKPDAKPALCLALPHWNSAWLNSLETAFLANAAKRGDKLLIHVYGQELDPLNLPKERIDALFVVPYRITVETLYRLKKIKPVVVFMGNCKYDEFSCVGADNAHIGLLAAAHFKELGHRKVAFVYTRDEHDEREITALERLKSFQNCCDLYKMECLPVEVLVKAGELDYQAAYAVFRKMLTREANFTAVCACCAPQALRALYENGLRVPEDIAVLAIGEDPINEFTCPSLSSISGSPYAIVDKAVEQAFAEMEGGAQPRWIAVKHAVVQRESTAKRKK